jgi:predicted transcriptional regulator
MEYSPYFHCSNRKNLSKMNHDIIAQTLRTYFLEKGKTIKVIQRYLRMKYHLIMDEKLLEKRLQNLSVN